MSGSFSNMSYQVSQRLRARNCSTVLGLCKSPCFWSCELCRRSWHIKGTSAKLGPRARCMYLSGYRSELTWLDRVAELSLRSSCEWNNNNSPFVFVLFCFFWYIAQTSIEIYSVALHNIVKVKVCQNNEKHKKLLNTTSIYQSKATIA